MVFARERESYEQIRHLCDARLAHDTAFFFDLRSLPVRLSPGSSQCVPPGRGGDRGNLISQENRDISIDCGTLDEWLRTISQHDLIRTDRAHVVIAAAMLGKRVECRSSSYHKVPAIVEFSISSGQVTLLEEWNGAATALPTGTPAPAESPPLEQLIGELNRAEGQSALPLRPKWAGSRQSRSIWPNPPGVWGPSLAVREAELAARAQENARLQLLSGQVEKRLEDSSRQLRPANPS